MSEGNGTQVGSIKWYNESKGYGFIQLQGGGKDVFVHANELRRCGIARALKEGDQVSFIMDNRPKGPYATNLSLVTP